MSDHDDRNGPELPSPWKGAGWERWRGVVDGYVHRMNHDLTAIQGWRNLHDEAEVVKERRLDERFTECTRLLDGRISRSEERAHARMDDIERSLGAQVHALEVLVGKIDTRVTIYAGVGALIGGGIVTLAQWIIQRSIGG